MDKLSQWMNFIKGDSKEVILEMARVNSEIEKAYDILRTMSQNREARALYLSREMALRGEVTRHEEALEGEELPYYSSYSIENLKAYLMI